MIPQSDWPAVCGVEALQQQQANPSSASVFKLQLAEQALAYSDRNIELTMQVLVQGPHDSMAPLLIECAQNNSQIAILVQRIHEYVELQDEKDLLEAASRRSIHHATIHGQTHFDTGAAMANVMLPLLLDNNSWRAFVQFLRAQ